MPRILGGGKENDVTYINNMCGKYICSYIWKEKKENVLMIILCAPVHDSSLHVYVREFREASIACAVNQA